MTLVIEEMMLFPPSQLCWTVVQRKMDGMRLLIPGSWHYVLCDEIPFWLVAEQNTPALCASLCDGPAVTGFQFAGGYTSVKM